MANKFQCPLFAISPRGQLDSNVVCAIAGPAEGPGGEPLQAEGREPAHAGGHRGRLLPAGPQARLWQGRGGRSQGQKVLVLLRPDDGA